ncbi:hypothetical protein TNCV_4272561 [Trichonephila clavipes]|nr:hypothetical protein TNCV_4272561 [Trichonephila clavipes]
MAYKDILEFVQSSKNIIDANSDELCAPVPKSSEMRIIIKPREIRRLLTLRGKVPNCSKLPSSTNKEAELSSVSQHVPRNKIVMARTRWPHMRWNDIIQSTFRDIPYPKALVQDTHIMRWSFILLEPHVPVDVERHIFPQAWKTFLEEIQAFG